MRRKWGLGLYHTPLDLDLITRAIELGADAIDTAANYHGGATHRFLRPIAHDCMIVTKIGFHPSTNNGPDIHSLTIDDLQTAAEAMISDLGCAPAVILLHNPERADSAQIGIAADFLANLATRELRIQWGFSVWDAKRAIERIPFADIARPDYLMTRCGLTIGREDFAAICSLRERLEVNPATTLGAAPLGGRLLARQLSEIEELRCIVAEDATPAQCMLQAAWNIPSTSMVFLSSSDEAHLLQAAEASALTPLPSQMQSLWTSLAR